MMNGTFFRLKGLKEEYEKKRDEESQKYSDALNLDPGKSLTHPQLEQLLGSHWRSKI